MLHGIAESGEGCEDNAVLKVQIANNYGSEEGLGRHGDQWWGSEQWALVKEEQGREQKGVKRGKRDV